MTKPEGVHHHVRLKRRGGAAKVAWLLARTQALGQQVSVSFELEEPGDSDSQIKQFYCPPADVAQLVDPGKLIHVHATGDWPGLLRGFATYPRPWVLTAHDCALLTGGCVYPVYCGRQVNGCQDPCPRAYPHSFALWREKRRLLPLAKPMLASPSAWLAKQLRKAWPEFKVSVIPNGVEKPMAGLDKGLARRELGIAPGAKVVLYLAHGGLMAAYKGGGGFKPLWAAIKHQEPGALGLVVGGDKTERQGDLLYFPYLEGRMLEVVFRAADVLIYPSLADNHPLIILEAMARELPVVANAVGGIPEQITSGQNGLLVPGGDEAGLIQGVCRLLSDRGLAKALAAQACQTWTRHFTVERMVEKYPRLYARAKP